MDDKKQFLMNILVGACIIQIKKMKQLKAVPTSMYF